MPEVCYERLRPADMVARRDASPIAWLPCGILEWHGRHNPLGLDGVKAHAICVRLAEAIGGLVWPTLWYGDHRGDILEHVFHPGRWQQLTHDHRIQVAEVLGIPIDNLNREAARCEIAGGWQLWKSVLDHALHQIAAYGFERIVVLTGHYPLRAPGQEAAAAFEAASGVPVMVMTEADPVAERGFHGDHAAKWETSLMLALDGVTVDLGALTDEPDEVLGVLGDDPRRATAEYGEAGLQALIEVMRERLAT